MHPVEHLRFVARADPGTPAALLACEAGLGLADLGCNDPAATVISARRLLSRHPCCGPLWWMASQVISASDPICRAEQCVQALDDDPTERLLGELLESQLGQGGPVSILDWSRNRQECGSLGPRVTDGTRYSGVSIVEATMWSSDGFIAQRGTQSAITAVKQVGGRVWVRAGVGVVVPSEVFELVCRQRLVGEAFEIISTDLVDVLVGPDGTHACPGEMPSCGWQLVPELSCVPYG